ncbi:MAG: hypothetical protein ABIR66_02730 [Saprospiraceae bacterium]
MKVWSAQYDIYSPLIYSIIYKMTGNVTITENILQKTFQISDDQLTTTARSTVLCRNLLRNAYNLTLDYLSSSGLVPLTIKPLGEKIPLVNLLYFELDSLKEAEERLHLSMQEVLVKLRYEFNIFHNQNQENAVIINTLNF